MEKEEIKNKVLEYFQVKELAELIAKSPREWLACFASIFGEESENIFEKEIKDFTDDWKDYFRSLINGNTAYAHAQRPFRWLQYLDTVSSDKFQQWLYHNLATKVSKTIITNQRSLMEVHDDFYSLTNKEFSTKYGVSNIL